MGTSYRSSHSLSAPKLPLCAASSDLKPSISLTHLASLRPSWGRLPSTGLSTTPGTTCDNAANSYNPRQSMGWWLPTFRPVYPRRLHLIVRSSVASRLALSLFNYRHGELVWTRVMTLYDKVSYHRYLFESFNLKFLDCLIGTIGDLAMDWSDTSVLKSCPNFVQERKSWRVRWIRLRVVEDWIGLITSVFFRLITLKYQNPNLDKWVCCIIYLDVLCRVYSQYFTLRRICPLQKNR